MRTSVIGIGLVALTVGWAAQAAGQGLVFDARRLGMGGLALGRSSNVVRYNAAYRAVPARAGEYGQPKVTIPIPLGLIQFLHDHPHISNDPAFNPDSAGFNPILVLNTLLNLPIYYEVKQAPTPTNDVVFDIGQNALRANLGLSAALVPEDQLGIGGSSRPLDPGIGIEKYQDFARGHARAEVASDTETFLGKNDQTVASIACDVRRGIRAAIGHHNHLESWVILALQRIERPPEIAFLVVGRDDDRNLTGCFSNDFACPRAKPAGRRRFR